MKTKTMKTIIQNTIITLFLSTLSCAAAPPYVPAPVVQATDLTWTAPPAGVDATIIHRSVDNATWQPAAVIPAPGNAAPGALTNFNGTAVYCATFTNSVGEGQPSVQLTNTFAPVPPAATGLQKQ
jgi:hypothetical protein